DGPAQPEAAGPRQHPPGPRGDGLHGTSRNGGDRSGDHRGADDQARDRHQHREVREHAAGGAGGGSAGSCRGDRRGHRSGHRTRDRGRRSPARGPADRRHLPPDLRRPTPRRHHRGGLPVTAMAPVGFGAPPPVVSTPPAPDVQEALARHVVAKRLGFSRILVRAPSWREILFGAGKLDFRLPRFPDGAAEKVDAKQPDPVDDADRRADQLIAKLSKDKPRGTSPRSVSARRKLPPSDDAMASWRRQATLTVLGPVIARLLVSSGGLTASDVEVLEDTYPEGLDLE